jgi:hypothetical protein
MLVRRDAAGVRLFTRNGHDWTGRFPLIARAALSLRAVSCLIDGEAVACDDDGLPVFDRLRYRRDDRRVFLYALGRPAFSFICPAPASCTAARPCASGTTRRPPAPLQSA